jgi:hypothetical protein
MIKTTLVVSAWILLFTIPALMLSIRGMSVGKDVPVRCSKGHYYSTIWIPGISFKAARLARRRYQRCPVGKHWAMTRQLFEDEKTPEIFAVAAKTHDRRII